MTRVEWRQLESTVARMSDEEKTRLLALLQASLESTKTITPDQLTPEEFNSELSRITFDAPPLPDDFSRADIYDEHD